MSVYSCYVFKATEYGKGGTRIEGNPKVTSINSTKICELNKRPVIIEEPLELTVETFEKECRSYDSQENQSDPEYYLDVSCNDAAQAMCHLISSKKNSSFKVQSEGNAIKITTENADWDSTSIPSADLEREEWRIKIAIRLGQLAEKAITTAGDGKISIKCGFRYGKKLRKSIREVDAVNRNGKKKLETTEIKCIGQLKMSKAKFFQQRLYSLIAKAIASDSKSAYVVVRDDRETNVELKDDDHLEIQEVQYWEDVSRFIPKEDCNKLEQFLNNDLCGTLFTALQNGTKIEKIINNEDKLIVEQADKPKVIKCAADIPLHFRYSMDKKVQTSIIVGPGIPYFDFCLPKSWIIYKYKYNDWKLKPKDERLIVIVKEKADVEEMFKRYKKHAKQRPIEVIFLAQHNFDYSFLYNVRYFQRNKDEINIETYSIINPEKVAQAIFQKRKQQSNSTSKKFITNAYDQLGEALYRKGLTYFPKPIPQLVLLLGEGQQIPLRLITARLSFGVLVKEDGRLKTGIKFSECPFPDAVAIIGTAEECQAGYQLAAHHYEEEFNQLTFKSRIICFVIDKGEIVESDFMTLVKCTAAELNDKMMESGLPVYHSFKKTGGQWSAS